MARGDFHLHSTASDGTLPPAEVVALAASQGVEVMALTDHDTTAGVAEAQAAGAAHGVEVIAGIEISTDLAEGGDAHLLGYFADAADEALQAQLERYRTGRAERGREILRKLEGLGFPLAWERVTAIAGRAAVGRPHVARAMVEAGYIDNVSLAFDHYLFTGGPADAPRKKLPPAEAVALIRDAGGVAVLAHPRYLPDPPAAIAMLAAAGLHGIEVYYKDHGPEEIARFGELAATHHLVPTGGSDYHGTKQVEHLPGDLPLPSDAVDAFLSFAQREWSQHPSGVSE